MTSLPAQHWAAPFRSVQEGCNADLQYSTCLLKIRLHLRASPSTNGIRLIVNGVLLSLRRTYAGSSRRLVLCGR